MSREEPTSNMSYFLNLPTVIDSKNIDANGKQISGSYELAQLRRWNKFSISRDSKRNNEVKAISEIDRIIEMLGLAKSVAKQANEIYHKQLSGPIRRRSISGMSAASVLVACYMLGIPCPVNEIERMSAPVSGKVIRRYYKLLLHEIGIRVTNFDPSNDVSRIATKAGLSGRSERKALTILASVKDNATLVGKRPISIAAAALYLASIQEGERANQLRLAFAAGVTPVTLRKRSLEITQILEAV
ncbi:MAG: transcription initiation factor IIB [Nitrososphaerales archaeon]